jgi:lipopolysaccharide/colanic/teichoic acid biosynthesis glycosyltransferase
VSTRVRPDSDRQGLGVHHWPSNFGARAELRADHERFVVAACRRVVEVLVAVVVLMVASPVLLATALIIRLDSPGPVLFRQIRMGRNGRLFTFYKFRTLYANAREMFPELYRYDYTPEELENLPVKVRNDPRVTKVGRWLRVSTLDELPNFWNLLKGDIALVGPRADVPDMLRNYRPEEMIKFSVKPGITGLAQTRGRGRLKFHEMNQYDVEYVLNRTVWLDCKIVLETAMLVIRLDGTF